MLRLIKRGLFIDSNSFKLHPGFTHTSNPLLINTGNFYRLFFNSRDQKNRSNVFSVDFDLENLELIQNTFKTQYLLNIATPEYCFDGISIGDFDKSDSSIGFMGWKNPKDEHWVGEIGKLYLNDEFEIERISDKPEFSINVEKSISYSYPAYTSIDSINFMWYGTTLDWRIENGEMLHVIRRRNLNENLDDFELQFLIDERQAFSRPTLLSTENISLLAYSFRGSKNKYRIGLNLLDVNGLPINNSPDQVFYPSENGWDSEMTEYPYLFEHNSRIFMLYNGNSYGKTGIGLVEIVL